MNKPVIVFLAFWILLSAVAFATASYFTHVPADDRGLIEAYFFIISWFSFFGSIVCFCGVVFEVFSEES